MALVESPNGTTVTISTLIDSFGLAWSLVQSATNGLQIQIGGRVDMTTADVSLLLIWEHGIYYQTSANVWYVRKSAAWTITADPRISAMPTEVTIVPVVASTTCEIVAAPTEVTVIPVVASTTCEAIDVGTSMPPMTAWAYWREIWAAIRSWWQQYRH